MTRQTRIALLLVLVFAVLFMVVVSDLNTKPQQATDTAEEGRKVETFYAQAPVIRNVPNVGQVNRPRPRHISLVAQGASSDANVQTTGRVYVVQANDSLHKIAQKVYGPQQGKEYRRIYQANYDLFCDQGVLREGQKLVIPPLAEPAKRQHVSRRQVVQTPSRQVRTYVVQPKDTLTAIARREMGDASRDAVNRLYKANRQRISNINQLKVGMTLVIPQ